MTNFSQLATLLRTYQTKLLKLNRNEDREDTIVANTEAAIHLGEAAASIDRAIKVLCPFPINEKKPEPFRRLKTGGQGETKSKNSTSAESSDWSTDNILATKSA